MLIISWLRESVEYSNNYAQTYIIVKYKLCREGFHDLTVHAISMYGGGGENNAISNGCKGEENIKNGRQEVSPEPHLSNDRDIMLRKDVILIIIGS